MTGLRHLLIVTSASPDFSHSQAAQTVCAMLASEFAGLVPKVTVGCVCAPHPVLPETAGRLAQLGADCVDFPSRLRASPPALHNKLETLAVIARSVLLNDGGRDCPCPDDVGALATSIDASGADAVLLFWDTLAEFVLPHLKTPVFGYLARPPQAAAMARVQAQHFGVRRSVDLMLLGAQSRRHFQRMKRLWGAANICSLDANLYTRNSVPCTYVPNTWDDPVGISWAEKRVRCEAERERPQILGNIGSLDATGNSFGLHYLGTKVLPVLAGIAGDIDWTISICGPRQPTADVAKALDHPRVVIKGFVADIDHEVLSSEIFLLLNNAGPYSGGYTRVIYAFATGACLIAHRNLALSMPELTHEGNCLLADTPGDIAALIDRALRDAGLRRRIGAAARRTYEEAYAPRRVAECLLHMIEDRLGMRGELRHLPAVQELADCPRAAEG